MKKYLALVLVIITSLTFGVFCNDNSTQWTTQQQQWLDENAGKTVDLGVVDFFGRGHFDYRGQTQGYLYELSEFISQETGITIRVKSYPSWGDVYGEFVDGKLDLLYGANETEERLKTMAFTVPVEEEPYLAIALKDSEINTLSDIDGLRVGFIAFDAGIDIFLDIYGKLNIEVVKFDSHEEMINGLLTSDVQAFVTPTAGIEKQFLYDYPQIKKIAELNQLHTEVRIATHKEQQMLTQIIDNLLVSHQQQVAQIINRANIIYNYRVLNISDAEYDWIVNHQPINVGVIPDYLPFDYYDDGKYKGILGEVYQFYSRELGLKFNYIYDGFDSLYQQALTGKIEMISAAKTDKRNNQFTFIGPIVKEIEEIYGSKQVPYVFDIYSLEGKRIAVINGYWHSEYLDKNLADYQIVNSANIEESIALVNAGKADYFIENPTVANFYIDGLGENNIEKKGITHSDSYVHIGVIKSQTELASLLTKINRLLDLTKAKENGLKDLPTLTSKSVKYLWLSLLLAGLIIALFGIALFRSIRSLIKARETTLVLKEREKLLYKDALTAVYNRMYYNALLSKLQEQAPLGIITFDLNNFKLINDTYGHLFGDLYLSAFASQLSDVFKDDITIRMGGDEFTVIEQTGNITDIKLKIAKLKRYLSKTTVEYNNHAITHIDAAVGYAIRSDINISIEETLVQADEQMYQNKATSKNQRIGML